MSKAMTTYLAGAAISALLPQAAWAQADASARRSEDVTASAGNDEIIVTARRREELISKTPVAVTAVGEAQIAQAGIRDLDGIRSVTPGLVSISSPIFRGTLTQFIRGQGESGTDQSADPVIATYVNGIYMPSGTAAAFDLFDVQQVEVLRGAQGTLFGKNTTSGAVLITTKGPGEEFGGEVNLALGSYGRRTLTAAVDIPFSADWGIRAAAGIKKSDGDYLNGQDNSRAGGDDAKFGRLTIAGELGFLSAKIVGEYLRDEGDTPGAQILGGPAFNTVAAASQPAPFLPISTRRPGLVFHDKRDGLNTGFNKQWQISGALDFDLGSLGTLTSTTGYYDIDSDQFVDNSGVPYEAFVKYRRLVKRHQFSEEFKLNSTIGSIDLVTGVYYANALVSDGNLISGTLLGATPVGQPPFTVVGVQPIFKIRQRDKSYAAFADAIVPIVDGVRINAGIRYSSQTKAITGGTVCGFTNVEPGDFSSCARNFNQSAKFTHLDPKIGIDVDLTPDVLGYAKFQTAFRSGGFNGRSSNGNYGPYQQEVVHAYEVGVKGRILDNKLNFALVGFYNEYDGLQAQFVQRVPNPFGPTPAFLNNTTVENAAGATSKGVELEASLRASNALRLSTSVAYLDVNFESFIIPSAAGGTVDLSNNSPRYSPKWSGSLRADYTHELSDGGNFTANLTAYLTSSYQTYVNVVPGDRAETRDDGYTRLDSTVTWNSAGERFYLQLQLRNLTKARYLLFANSAGTGVGFFGTTAPGRTFLVQGGVKF